MTDEIERLRAERDALRVANASTMAMAAQASEYMQQAFAERDALRELLRQARYSVQYELRARIDAALEMSVSAKRGGVDET